MHVLPFPMKSFSVQKKEKAPKTEASNCPATVIAR